MKKSVAGGGGQGNGAGGVGAATAAAAGGAERVQRSPHHTDLTITNITHAHKAATNVRHRESKAIHALRRPAPTANMVHAYEAISAMAYHIQVCTTTTSVRLNTLCLLFAFINCLPSLD